MIFLQHVVAMSEQVYERRLIARILERRRRGPSVWREAARFVAALLADSTALSFTSEAAMRLDSRVRVFTEIWRA